MAYVYDDSGEHEELPSKEEVAARLSRWESRLNALYARIEKWLPSESGYVLDRSSRIPVNEPLMQAVGLAPGSLPKLSITHPDGSRLVFFPSGLWMIGGNGQVSAVADRLAWKLVDRGTDDAPHWTVYTRRPPIRSVEFDCDAFRRMLAEAA